MQRTLIRRRGPHIHTRYNESNSRDERKTSFSNVGGYLLVFIKYVVFAVAAIAIAFFLTKLSLFVIAAAHLSPEFIFPFLNFINGNQVFFALLVIVNSLLSGSFLYSQNLSSNLLSFLERFLHTTFALLFVYAAFLSLTLLSILPVIKVIFGVIVALSSFGIILQLLLNIIILPIFHLIVSMFSSSVGVSGPTKFIHQSIVLGFISSLFFLLLTVLPFTPVVPMLTSIIPSLFVLHQTAYTIISYSFISLMLFPTFIRFGRQFISPVNDVFGSNFGSGGIRKPDYISVVFDSDNEDDDVRLPNEIHRRLESASTTAVRRRAAALAAQHLDNASLNESHGQSEFAFTTAAIRRASPPALSGDFFAQGRGFGDLEYNPLFHRINGSGF